MTAGAENDDVRRMVISPVAVDVLDFERDVAAIDVPVTPAAALALFAAELQEISADHAVKLSLCRQCAGKPCGNGRFLVCVAPASNGAIEVAIGTDSATTIVRAERA